jgi:hypothetical protein
MFARARRSWRQHRTTFMMALITVAAVVAGSIAAVQISVSPGARDENLAPADDRMADGGHGGCVADGFDPAEPFEAANEGRPVGRVGPCWPVAGMDRAA